MKKLIFHAGLHKTGSSAIQKSLASNSNRLIDHGICYPECDPFDAHHILVDRLRKAGNIVDAQLDLKKTFSTFLSKSNVNTVVLSSEMASEQPCLGAFSVLSELFDFVEVIFYVRNQDEMVESAYNQQVKQNFESRYISEYQPYMTDYFNHITSFKTVIDRANIKIYNYSALMSKDSPYFRDAGRHFIDTVLKIDSESLDSTAQVANSSLTPVACRVLAGVYRLIPEVSGYQNLIEFVNSYFGLDCYENYTLISPSARSSLRAGCMDSNSRLFKEYEMDYEICFPKIDKIYLSETVMRKILENSKFVESLRSYLNAHCGPDDQISGQAILHELLRDY